MRKQWKLPGPTSAYLVTWWYDERAKDTQRHVSAFAVRTALEQWVRSRRQIVREIYEALEGSQSLDISRGKEKLRDDQIKARIAEAFSKGRLVVLVSEETAPSKDQLLGNVVTRQASLLIHQAGTSGAPQVKQIIQCEDFLVLLLDDLAKTRITVPVNLCPKLQPGRYRLYNANGKVTLRLSDAVLPPLTEWTPPNVNLPAQVDYEVVIFRLPLAHWLQATPMVTKTPIGTQFEFSVHMEPEIGGRYEYKWRVYQDPTTAKKNGASEILDGPTSTTLKLTSKFTGRHRIACELTFVGSHHTSKEMLEYLQVVAPEDDILNAAFAVATAPKYDLFRIDLELHKISMAKGGLKEQNVAGVPYIQNSGMNPASPGIAPDHATHTYTVVPVPDAKKFRWYVRCEDWRYMPTHKFHGYKRVVIDDAPAFDLGATGKTAKWIIASTNIYTIVCEQFDAGGQKIGTAWYRQVVESAEESKARNKFQRYAESAEAGIDKIRDGKELGLQAAYLNRETGQTLALTLFVGPSAGNGGGVMLVDLLPGVDRIEYHGASLEAALEQFEDGNSYPEGSIKLEIPHNSLGYSQITKTIRTRGESIFARWSGRVGWASLGLTVLGVVAGVIPGGQPVAMVCFIAAGAAGAASGGLNLYDRLQKAEVSGVGVALDVATIAGSMIGTASAVRALKVGTALTFAGRTGRFFLYSGFTTDALAGLLISAEGADQLNAVLDNPELSRSEKVGAIVRVLATLVLQGGLLALSIKDLKNVREQLGSILGKEATAKLAPEVLQVLYLLDRSALKKLAGMGAEQLEQMARLIGMFGKELADHEFVASFGRVSINGQIKLHPKLMARLEHDDLRKILDVSKALKNFGGNLEKLPDQEAVKSLTETSGLRLRFEGQLRQAMEHAKKLGANGKIFSKMTEDERERLFDLLSAKRGTGNWMKQASHWALSRSPNNVHAYVALVELYVKKFENALGAAETAYRREVDAKVAALTADNPQSKKATLRLQVERELSSARFNQAIDGYGKVFMSALREELEKAWGRLDNVAEAGLGAQIVEDAYRDGAERLKGRIGSTRLGAGLTIEEALSQIMKLPGVKFASEESGVYHVVKHGRDLPPSETTGDMTVDFLASALKTIQSKKSTYKVTQGGTSQFHFVREFSEKGKDYAMLAIVNMSDNGEVTLTTYMNRRTKK